MLTKGPELHAHVCSDRAHSRMVTKLPAGAAMANSINLKRPRVFLRLQCNHSSDKACSSWRAQHCRQAIGTHSSVLEQPDHWKHIALHPAHSRTLLLLQLCHRTE